MQDFFEELGAVLFLLLTGIGICAVYIHFVQLIDRQLPGKEQQRRIFQFTEIFSRRRCPGRQWFFFLHVCGINFNLRLKMYNKPSLFNVS